MTSRTDPSRVLVTGAEGFIGRNLVVALRRAGVAVTGVDVDSSPAALAAALDGAEVVYHLAGVNRTQSDDDFVTGNIGSLETVLVAASRTASKPTIVLSSSTQAALDNPYGRSKREAERMLEAYTAHTGNPGVIYRFPGVFGKWCRPHYNSVVATFCYNVARDRPITASDPSKSIELVYVTDVVNQLLKHLEQKPVGLVRDEVQPVFRTTLGELVAHIRGFRAMRQTLEIPPVDDPFVVRLLATFHSYLEPTDLAYELEQRSDDRGVLAELVKAGCLGQIFVSRTRPGMTRGNHYHDTKVEKFCVIDGDAIIRFRSILSDVVTELRVAGTEFKVVDIPPGMTHNIENVGKTDMIVLFWASETFDSARSDTYYEEVVRG